MLVNVVCPISDRTKEMATITEYFKAGKSIGIHDKRKKKVKTDIKGLS